MRPKKISGDILEAFLDCKTKAYCKLQGEQGPKTEYEILCSDMREKICHEMLKKARNSYAEAEASYNMQATISLLKRGGVFFKANIENSNFNLIIDGLQKVAGTSKLGDFHYLPMLGYEGRNIQKNQKLLVAIIAVILGDWQGRLPTIGLIYHGMECKLTKIKLSTELKDKAVNILRDIEELYASKQPPSLILNRHCRTCEFNNKCHIQAIKEDNLSLLRGMSEKEIKKYNRKGIFTTTQLSCTFRIRKRGKRVRHVNRPHYFALQAAAIRDNKVYVLKPPDIPKSSVQIYLDVEGVPDRSFVYLLGMLVIDHGVEKWYFYWIDRQDQENDLFQYFLEVICKFDNFTVFHYGSYESSFLKKMNKKYGKTKLIKKVLDCSCNILSTVYSFIYFPLYSNGLKEIGEYLGCCWSSKNADGLQSIVWRNRWEENHSQVYRNKLEMYNHEDCIALYKLVQFLIRIQNEKSSDNCDPPEYIKEPDIAPAESINPSISRRELGPTSFVISELAFVNKCAYFDYQRDRIFLHTNDVLRRIHHRKKRRREFES